MSESNNNNNNNSPSSTTPHQHDHWQPWPPSALSMARTALSLTTQPWAQTGRGPVSGHPSILSPPSFISSGSTTANNNNSIVDEITERMVSLLLIRIVALVTCRLGNMAVQQTNNNNNSGGDNNKDNGHHNHRRASNESATSSKNDSGGGYRRMKDKMYVDYSTSTICRSALKTAKGEGKRIRTQQQQVGEPAISIDELTDDNEHDDDGDGAKMSKSLHVRVGNQKYNLDNDGDEKMAAAEDDWSPMTTLRQYSSEPKSYSITINTSRRSSSINNHHSSTSTTKSSTISGLFPKCITPQIIHQLRTYVHTICSQYHSPHRVPYHNVEHAYHVFLSANKLLDLMLCEHTDDKEDQLLLAEDEEVEGGAQQQQQQQHPESKSSTPKHNNNNNNNNNNPRPKFRRATLDSLLDHRPTYGIKSDPLTQLAFLFSALVHDVDHTGISNRQLVLESDDLAILYNDQSVAEQRSLAIAFSVLKRGEFDELRRVLFETTSGG
eukprot:CAMPEP_0113420604 /NCGR_PEP_ID=MMETSP0013_2-20120614/27418_1 /TAXON_ID=2843 ORGANISM="Skeletonema costatum, Strain 1716" /NCGR_SAMPLE_ID=MMETSP0013_2 /ASSEMBLY_ACC=CAM_ASM_000158 /LENGTH=493 /DNA_ID=CAMNT_0000308097 /DNA_START=185 /DNA_END=1662 /DNA_ORIENTATION=+ /assembly_acc=CAM_ASM_000158